MLKRRSLLCVGSDVEIILKIKKQTALKIVLLKKNSGFGWMFIWIKCSFRYFFYIWKMDGMVIILIKCCCYGFNRKITELFFLMSILFVFPQLPSIKFPNICLFVKMWIYNYKWKWWTIEVDSKFKFQQVVHRKTYLKYLVHVSFFYAYCLYNVVIKVNNFQAFVSDFLRKFFVF